MGDYVLCAGLCDYSGDGVEAEEMTKQEFWEMIGNIFEIYEVKCIHCPACGDDDCATSCEQVLKSVYERLERESNEET